MSGIFERLFSLRGKTALVTGAGGGIGSALALAFAEAGATVALNGVSPAKLQVTQSEIEKVGGKCVVLARDVSRVADCRGLIQDAQRLLGRLDILVNCAGVNRRKPVREVSEEDYDFIAGVNLKSVFFLCQAAYPIMKAQGGGKVINIGSITTTDGLAGVAVYGATKAAVGQLTRTLALEWAADNIQVNCLAPGFMLTPLTAEGIWGDPHRKEWLTARIPLKRAGQPEELTGAALLLAGAGSSYLTGQIINVDGGYLAGGSWLKANE